LIDIDRIVFALVGAIVIDTADVLVLIGKLPKPWAPHHLLSGYGAYPDIPVSDMAEYIGPVVFPPVDLANRSRQVAAAIARATLSTLITVFHGVVRCPFGPSSHTPKSQN
jgi:hypothetical protein